MYMLWRLLLLITAFCSANYCLCRFVVGRQKDSIYNSLFNRTSKMQKNIIKLKRVFIAVSSSACVSIYCLRSQKAGLEYWVDYGKHHILVYSLKITNKAKCHYPGSELTNQSLKLGKKIGGAGGFSRPHAKAFQDPFSLFELCFILLPIIFCTITPV